MTRNTETEETLGHFRLLIHVVDSPRCLLQKHQARDDVRFGLDRYSKEKNSKRYERAIAPKSESLGNACGNAEMAA
jgi:hypothetical protein